MPWAFRMERQPSCNSARREILAAGSVRRRLVGWGLGREIRLRQQWSPAFARNDFIDGERIWPARGQLVALGPKPRWQFRRIVAQLHRATNQGPRAKHRVANRLGLDRIARGR